MFGLSDLKQQIEVTDTTVECPVKKCSIKVPRQREVFKRDEKFKCPRHQIYISPSTFEYQREEDNLLWKDKHDLALLSEIKKVKRESRIARDNSEDAVTWNVFRFLERNNLVEKIINSLIGASLDSSEVIYWSYSQNERNSWSNLNKARQEFGEEIERSSEPDIIIISNKVLIFLEAKLSASNETIPTNLDNPKKYISGGNNWFKKVFRSSYETVAIKEKKYELLRFWLLGSWLANELGLDYYLINLVLSSREKDIGDVFGRHIIETHHRKFMRLTWEDIYQQILVQSGGGPERKTVLNYFKNKTIGYDGKGRLQRFLLSPYIHSSS